MGNFRNYIEEKEKNDIIKTGYNISDSFWKDFLLLLNNSRGVSSLLDVPKNKVSSWGSKINQALKEYENKQKEYSVNKKERIIKTGFNIR